MDGDPETSTEDLEPRKSQAQAIYQEQISRDWPGLSTEDKYICEAIGIEDVNLKEVDKEAMEEAIFFHSYREMKQELEKYSKLEDTKHNDFTKLPDYIEEKCLEKCRLAFRIKLKMVTCVSTIPKKA